MARFSKSIPNILTYGRLIAVPAIAVILYIDFVYAGYWALGLFVAASFTDFLDGYLARRFEVTSSLGRMLDPIADKILVSTTLVMLIYGGQIGPYSLPAALIILTREVMVSGLREFLSELQVTVPVTYIAKWKTAFQLASIVCILWGGTVEQAEVWIKYMGLTLLWTSAMVTLYTGWDYFRASFKHFSDVSDEERSGSKK